LQTDQSHYQKESDKIWPMIALISILPIMMLTVGFSTQEADAAKCYTPDHCYALHRYNDATVNGLKYNTIVSDMVPITPCSTVMVAAGWVALPNGDWLEAGFTSGSLAGNCYSTKQGYYAYQDSFGYSEYNAGTLTVGSTHTFEISDANTDKYWNIKRNTSNLAQVLMAYSYGTVADRGIEGNRNNPSTSWIPTTHFWNGQKYQNGAWSNISGGQGWFYQDTSYGYYIGNCDTTHFHARTGGTLTCSGSH
jgi:hypothetical protein